MQAERVQQGLIPLRIPTCQPPQLPPLQPQLHPALQLQQGQQRLLTLSPGCPSYQAPLQYQLPLPLP